MRDTNLRIVFCVTSMHRNRLEIQPRAQIDGSDDVSITGRYDQKAAFDC